MDSSLPIRVTATADNSAISARVSESRMVRHRMLSIHIGSLLRMYFRLMCTLQLYSLGSGISAAVERSDEHEMR